MHIVCESCGHVLLPGEVLCPPADVRCLACGSKGGFLFWCSWHDLMHGGLHPASFSICLLCNAPVCNTAGLELAVQFERLMTRRERGKR